MSDAPANPLSEAAHAEARARMSDDPLTDDWRDLDRQVAKALRFGEGFSDWEAWWSGYGPAHGEFASDMGHAWKVVEEMRKHGWRFEMEVSPDFARGATATFSRAGCEGRASAGTPMLAICRAMLEARAT